MASTEISDNVLYSENKDFINDYLEVLINRLTHSNMALEKDLGNPDDSKNAIKLKDNMNAFKYLLSSVNDTELLSEDLIIKVASMVNDSSPFISNGYRKIGNKLAETDILISKPDTIKNDMSNLIEDYNNLDNSDIFEKEARFHINFIKIHPFEDGNGRTSRLILNYNLLKQGIAPVIITDDLLEYYHTYIADNDVDSMKKLFIIQSTKENNLLNEMFGKYNTNYQQDDNNIKK